MSEMSPHVRLALDSIFAYVKERKIISPPTPLPDELTSRAGVFVSLKKHNELRGCIGTIEPIQSCVAQEIVHNAISAATRDPRFLPVEPDELEFITCSVDVLSPSEAIDDICLLDPIKYGVIVECGMKRGLLLPNLPGIESVEDQVDIACRKAMIRPGEPVNLYRFEVKRYV